MILSVTIPPAFEYAGIVMDWFWIVVLVASAFGLGWVCGGRV